MPSGHFLFTSESVSMGHPDKVADQVSDAVLDALLTQDPKARVACETLVTTNLCILAGEITAPGADSVDYEQIARKTMVDIGYTDASFGIDGRTCEVQVRLDPQSPDIAMGVDRDGAGDQGLMFGFACRETPELMPMPIQFSHQILTHLAELRFSKKLPWLRPDNKSQVTIEYRDGNPVRVDTIVVSAQHAEDVSQADIREAVIEECIKKILPEDMIHDTKYHINPTGKFVIGGPHGDCGLTGRKIIVDTYGGRGRHGGGAFSGKDPSKVDRSACYMARYVAKNIVAADLADECEVQLAYAIGVPEPVSVYVDTFGTGAVDEDRLAEAVQKVFRLTPHGIIESLDLLRPIYQRTAAGGHFGREDFPWEQRDKVDALKDEVGAVAMA